MEYIFKGNLDYFLSSDKLDDFKSVLFECKTEKDYNDIKASDFIKDGFAYTIKKTHNKLFVNLMTEKEARRIELKMRLKDRIDIKKNGQNEFNKKIKEEEGLVPKNIFKKYMKALNANSTRVIAPSDIINNLEKYGDICRMLSNDMFCKEKHIIDYYEAVRTYLGLEKYSLPDELPDNEQLGDERHGVDLNNEQDTEEEYTVSSEEHICNAACC